MVLQEFRRWLATTRGGSAVAAPADVGLESTEPYVYRGRLEAIQVRMPAAGCPAVWEGVSPCVLPLGIPPQWVRWQKAAGVSVTPVG